jgi:hypothetical protein
MGRLWHSLHPKFHGIHILVLEDATPFSTLTYSLLEEVENTLTAHLHSLETLKLIGSIPCIMRRLRTPVLKKPNITLETLPNEAMARCVLSTSLTPITSRKCWRT